jgi:hypothetical protein
MRYLTSRLSRLLHDEGGFLQFLPMIATLAGSLLGKGAQGAAQGRQAETQNVLNQDQQRTQQYGIAQNAQFDKANLDLQQKNFEENSRGGRAKQALIGSLLSNLQDASLNVPGVEGGSVSGGLRASALGDMGRLSAGVLAKQALMKQLTGDEFVGAEILQPPGLSSLPKASGWEKAAGIGGILGTLGGGIGEIWQGMQTPKLTGTALPVTTGVDNIRLPGEVDPTKLWRA